MIRGTVFGECNLANVSLVKPSDGNRLACIIDGTAGTKISVINSNEAFETDHYMRENKR
jgi:hypothetical protein